MMPAFMGTLQSGRSEQLDNLLAASKETPASSMVLPTAELEQNLTSPTDAPVLEKGKRLETGQMLVLENVLSTFKRPNFMDVKLGKRLWADDAPLAKRVRFDDVSAKTTSGSLGFRVAGMQVWEPVGVLGSRERDIKDTKIQPCRCVDGSEATDGVYRAYNKLYGRSLRDDTVQDAFKELLCLGTDTLPKDLLGDVVRDMDSLIEDIEITLASKSSRMYSASLLLVFEGDPERRKELIDAAVKRALQASDGTKPQDDLEDEDDDDEGDEDEPRLLDVRMIDFAHAEWTSGIGPDENTLVGIRNVRRVIQGLAE